MYIDDFVWLPDILEKLAAKHRVTEDEVEEIFFNRPQFRFVEAGHREGEDVYAAMGQTDAGRYLIVVFFIHKPSHLALIVSARDMDAKEREDMSGVDREPKTSISKAQTIQEVGEFWDAHSLSDHWEETKEASFEIRANRRRRVTIDPQIYSRLEAAAHTRGVSPETLVNLWLAEHLTKKRNRVGPS